MVNSRHATKVQLTIGTIFLLLILFFVISLWITAIVNRILMKFRVTYEFVEKKNTFAFWASSLIWQSCWTLWFGGGRRRFWFRDSGILFWPLPHQISESRRKGENRVHLKYGSKRVDWVKTGDKSSMFAFFRWGRASLWPDRVFETRCDRQEAVR